MPFTHLERSILDVICAVERPDMPTLREVLTTAVVVSRENTGHGFYTHFRTSASTGGRWIRMIDGPSASMVDMGIDAVMGFILWCSEIGPTTLEGYQLGDAAGNTVDLATRELDTLQFSEITF